MKKKKLKSSYNKIKEEIAYLKQDIYNLVRESENINGLTTKLKWELHYKLVDYIMFGDATKDDTWEVMTNRLSLIDEK